MKWRVIEEGTPNSRVAPWDDAIGIEEVDDSLMVPAIICWLCRGHNLSVAQQIVDLHNKAEE